MGYFRDPQGDLRPGTTFLVGFFTQISKKWVWDSKSLRNSFYVDPPRGGGRGYDSSHFLRTENSFGIIWPSPRQLRVKNTLRVGHRGPVGRKTTQKPPQNTKKWKKIVKKRLFSRFGHFGQNSDFSRKKSKTGIFFDITKPPLAQIYPKSGL